VQRRDCVENKTLPGWKKGLAISLALSITAALFVFFIYFEEDTLLSILTLRADFLFWACVLFFSLWLIEGLRIKLLIAALGNEKKISLVDAVQVFLVTFFFASVTPFAAGEWPAQIAALHRKGFSVGEASAVTLTRAFLTKLIFTITALLFLLYNREEPIPAFVNKVFIYAVCVSFSLSFLLFILLWRPALLEWLLQKLDGHSRSDPFPEGSKEESAEGGSRAKKIIKYLKDEINKFSLATSCFSHWKAGTLAVILFLTVLFWLCFLSIGPVLLMGLNMPVPYLKTLAWQFVVQLILPYIPLPGGSGVVELALAGLFKFFVPSSVLGLFIIAWRFFTYYLLLLFGGFAALASFKP